MTLEVEVTSTRKLNEVFWQRQDFRDDDKHLCAVISIHLLVKSWGEETETASWHT